MLSGIDSPLSYALLRIARCDFVTPTRVPKRTSFIGSSGSDAARDPAASTGDRADKEEAGENTEALSAHLCASDIVLYSPEEYERERDIPGTVARVASVEGRVLYERAA